ncbi:MAG: alpha-L-fucosidase [Victivallales bacterium]
MKKTQRSDTENRKPDQAWFNEAKFGIFVHWGVYSILGRGEWVMFKGKIPKPEYNLLTEQFRPEKFNADAWADLAVRAGAKYMVFTTRHHDGFAMYDSKVSDYNSVKTAAGRDFVREFVVACRKAGLRIGLYHSVMSWQWPAIFTGPAADPEGWKAMVRESHEQVREILSNYGKIDMLWYDGAVVPGIQDDGMQARYWRSRELNAMVRRLQPDILINDRSGLPEDFTTPEQHVTAPAAGRRWEACMTLNSSWGYNSSDRNFKSPKEVIDCLIYAARFGGNLLLNVGPKADGTIQPEFTRRLKSIGDWLKVNGEAIYGASRNAYSESNHACGPVTRKGRKAYLFISGNTGKTLRMDGLNSVNVEASILGSGSIPKIKTVSDMTVDMGGLPLISPDRLPVVLSIKSKIFGVPANTLGQAGKSIRMKTGDSPVLGQDCDRFSPPEPPVIDGPPQRILFSNSRKVIGSDSSKWCPGWTGRTIFSMPANQSPVLNISVPVDGLYDIALGLIAKKTASVEISINGIPVKPARRLHYGGCPDTAVIEGRHLSQGHHKLSVKSSEKFGIYALKITPRWKALPSEKWLTIGPFPTGFGPQSPVCEVRKAMTEVFPPEKDDFGTKGACKGIGGDEIRWRHSKLREGEHSDVGVDFPYRCGTKHSGVCYARTNIISSKDCKAILLIGCDWWANAWLNGSPVISRRPASAVSEDGAQFNGWKPTPAEIHLKKGINTLLVKCHRGSCATWFTCRINDTEDVKIEV